MKLNQNTKFDFHQLTRLGYIPVVSEFSANFDWNQKCADAVICRFFWNALNADQISELQPVLEKVLIQHSSRCMHCRVCKWKMPLSSMYNQEVCDFCHMKENGYTLDYDSKYHCGYFLRKSKHETNIN